MGDGRRGGWRRVDPLLTDVTKSFSHQRAYSSHSETARPTLETTQASTPQRAKRTSAGVKRATVEQVELTAPPPSLLSPSAMSSLFAPPAVTISFPGSKNRVYYPGDVVSGVVHLRVDRNGKGKTSMDRVEVQLKGTIRTTFAFRPSSAAATGVKKTARETKRLAKSSSSGHNEMEIYQDGPTEIVRCLNSSSLFLGLGVLIRSESAFIVLH